VQGAAGRLVDDVTYATRLDAWFATHEGCQPGGESPFVLEHELST
jgi:hypothetical protein